MPRQYNDPMIYSTYEGIAQDKYVIATYLIAGGMRSDIVAKAAALVTGKLIGDPPPRRPPALLPPARCRPAATGHAP